MVRRFPFTTLPRILLLRVRLSSAMTRRLPWRLPGRLPNPQPLRPRRRQRLSPSSYRSCLTQGFGMDRNVGDLRERLAELEFHGFSNVMHLGDGKVGFEGAMKPDYDVPPDLVGLDGEAVEHTGCVARQFLQHMFHRQGVDASLVPGFHRHE